MVYLKYFSTLRVIFSQGTIIAVITGGCCRECGSVEHFKKDCPDLQKKKGTVACNNK